LYQLLWKIIISTLWKIIIFNINLKLLHHLYKKLLFLMSNPNYYTQFSPEFTSLEFIFLILYKLFHMRICIYCNIVWLSNKNNYIIFMFCNAKRDIANIAPDYYNRARLIFSKSEAVFNINLMLNFNLMFNFNFTLE
jgi:hypothetical protein